MIDNYNNMPVQQNNEEESALRLSDLWEMIWGYKWWYVASVVLCLVFVAFYIYRTPDTYVRTAKVIIDESEQDATMRSLGAITGGAMRMRSNATVANEMEALASPDLMQMVVERLDLETRYVEHQFLREVELYGNQPFVMGLVDSNPKSSFSFTASSKGKGNVILKDFKVGRDDIDGSIECALGDTISTPAGTIVLLPSLDQDGFKNDITVFWSNSMSMAKRYCSKLTVSLSGKESTVVVLSMEDNYPARSSAILSSLIDVYNAEWVRNKNRSARNTSEFINDRLIIIERELGAIERELKNYKQDNRLTDIDAVSRAYLEESTQYASKSFEVSNQLSIANYIREYLSIPANENSLIPANLGLTSGNVDSQINEYNSIVLQRDRLISGSGSNNPLIEDLNASLAALRSAILRSVENTIATLELQAKMISSQEDQIMARIASSSGQELELLSIQRQKNVKESLYIFLLEKREENEIASLINVGNTRLIMNPNGSPSPVAPNKMMLIFAAFVLGCGIPFAVIFLIVKYYPILLEALSK